MGADPDPSEGLNTSLNQAFVGDNVGARLRRRDTVTAPLRRFHGPRDRKPTNLIGDCLKPSRSKGTVSAAIFGTRPKETITRSPGISECPGAGISLGAGSKFAVEFDLEC